MYTRCSRIHRENDVEGWEIRTRDGESRFFDVAIILFEENRNKIFVFSNSSERLSNDDFLITILDLVHFLPDDFELIRKEIPENPFDVYIETFIEMAKEL